MRKLFILHVHGSHIIWLCSTSSNTQVIRNYSPQSMGRAETLIFWLQASGMALYLQLICPAGASLQMTGGHYALVICDHCPPRGMSRSLILSLQFHTMWTTSWQNHDSSPLQSITILHCHGCLCLSITYISSALWRQCKSEITAHLPGYPCPAQGLG